MSKEGGSNPDISSSSLKWGKKKNSVNFAVQEAVILHLVKYKEKALKHSKSNISVIKLENQSFVSFPILFPFLLIQGGFNTS